MFIQFSSERVSVPIRPFLMDNGDFGIQKEELKILERYVGFSIAGAGIAEDEDGAMTLILYRRVTQTWRGLTEDTYCYPCVL